MKGHFNHQTKKKQTRFRERMASTNGQKVLASKEELRQKKTNRI